VPYQLTTPDPVNGKPRLRSTEYWRDDALAIAAAVAARMNVPVTVQQVRTRGGVPKVVEVIHPPGAKPKPS
jgi:anti-sigma-K factor RskA